MKDEGSKRTSVPAQTAPHRKQLNPHGAGVPLASIIPQSKAATPCDILWGVHY